MLSVHRSKQTWTRTVDRYIALTEFARSKFVHGGLPADKIVVKPNCVDPDPGERTETIGEYALFVGRVSEEKGALTLIRAWQKVKERIPLRIMGDGPALGSLETQVAAARMDHVSFIERQSRDAVIAAMKGARFVIFPSQLYENMPLTILEAFACGVPVVASRLGAMQEMVEEEVTGAFFNPNDADDLARVVGKTWSLGKDLQVWGKQARREFERHYSAPANYRALKRIYAEAIANRRAQPQGEAEIEPVAALQ
jgi:glycosyltransferase involved in cell wall biosynthesis